MAKKLLLLLTLFVITCLINCPAGASTLSQLVDDNGGMTYYDGNNGTARSFHVYLDSSAIGSSNNIVGSLLYSYSSTRVVTITDDVGDTGVIDATDNDTRISPDLAVAMYHIPNIKPGATVLNFTFDAAISQFEEHHSVLSGMLNTGAVTDGAVCSMGITPSSSAAGNLSDPTGVTPATNGDLIYSAAFDEQSPQQYQHPLTGVIFGSGYTGLIGETQIGTLAQALIQTSAENIKPSYTVTQPTFDPWAMCTVAYRTSSGAGAPRQAGKIVREMQSVILTNSTKQSWAFPCDTGNFIMISAENSSGSGGHTITSISDNAGNNWQSAVPGGTSAGYPQYWYAENATCNGQLSGTISSTNNGARTRLTFYEIPNALTSGALDTESEAHSTFTLSTATSLSASVTSPTQTTFSLAAAGGINNGDYLMASTEVVQVASGGGTKSITVNRGQFGTTALSSIGSGTGLYESLQPNQPSVTTTANNEIVFCSMNQGEGPNWNTKNAIYDFGAAAGQADGNDWANGDGNCHTYAPTAGTYNIGWYVSNQSTGDTAYPSALAVFLNTSSGSSAPPGQSTPTVSVTPIPGSITTTQTWQLQITVSGGGGNATPTGSVTVLNGSVTLATAQLTNGSVDMTFAAGTLPVGADTITVNYTPDSTSSELYDQASGSTTIAVTSTGTKTTPRINWTTPAAITYGTALSATQLDATANVSGSFTYSPGTGTVLTAGQHTLSVTFKPTDTADYNSATASVTLTVNMATPSIDWPTPAAVAVDTALSATQLDATANVPGTFVYNPPAGTVMSSAGDVTLSATFTPTDTTDYSSATTSVTLTVEGQRRRRRSH